MELNSHVIVAIFHLIVIAPLFLFVGMRRASVPEEVYQGLLVIGAFVLGYHLWRLSVKFRSQVSGQWVNLIHAVLIAPLLIYIGANKKETPRYAYELLTMTGFAALGYHLITLVQSLN
jgi:hypothetical protein